MIAENTVPSPEMVGMITSVLVKTAPEREDSETRTVGFIFLSLPNPNVFDTCTYSTVFGHWRLVVYHWSKTVWFISGQVFEMFHCSTVKNFFKKTDSSFVSLLQINEGY